MTQKRNFAPIWARLTRAEKRKICEHMLTGFYQTEPRVVPFTSMAIVINKLYHVGDVVLTDKCLEILGQIDNFDYCAVAKQPQLLQKLTFFQWLEEISKVKS